MRSSYPYGGLSRSLRKSTFILDLGIASTERWSEQSLKYICSDRLIVILHTSMFAQQDLLFDRVLYRFVPLIRASFVSSCAGLLELLARTS